MVDTNTATIPATHVVCETKVDGKPCGYHRPASDMCAVHMADGSYKVACVKCAGIARGFRFKTENLAVVQRRIADQVEMARREDEARKAYWGNLVVGEDRQADAKARRQNDRQQRVDRAVKYDANRDGVANGYAHVG